MVTIPTTKEIKDQIISDIEGKLGITVPWLPKNFIRILAKALAGIQTLAYRVGLWCYKQIFAATADEEALIRRGAQYGLSRSPAVRAKHTAQATGDDDIQIPGGTLWIGDDNGLVYQQQETVVITAGVATITNECLTAGDAGNLLVDDTLKIASPIAGIDDEATVTGTITTGEDQESIENFRKRIMQREKDKPQGGAASDYIGWAIKVAGIAEAYAFRPTPGFVNVYPLTDDPDLANRIPSSGKLTEVEDYLNETKRKPFGATVLALAMTELDFDVDIADLSPNDAITKANIETVITAYMYARRPQQYEDEVNPINVVSAGEIYFIAIAAGAKILTVTLKNAGGSPITSYTLQDHELSVLRDLTWV